MSEVPKPVSKRRGARLLMAGALSGATLLSACGGDTFDTEERNVQVGVTCEGGSNIVVSSPFNPSRDSKIGLFTTGDALQPEMIGEGAETLEDAGDFKIVVACETGPITLDVREDGEDEVSPESFEARTSVDAIIDIKTRDKSGTEDNSEIIRYATEQTVEVAFHGGDSVGYITLNNADEVIGASVNTLNGQFDLV